MYKIDAATISSGFSRCWLILYSIRKLELPFTIDSELEYSSKLNDKQALSVTKPLHHKVTASSAFGRSQYNTISSVDIWMLML